MSALEFINQTVVSSTNTSALNIGTTSDKLFTSKYDVYFITTDFSGSTTNPESVQTRLIDSSGNVITDTEYDRATHRMFSNSSFDKQNNEGANSIIGLWGEYDQAPENALASGYVINPADSGSFTYFISKTIGKEAGNLVAKETLAVHRGAEEIIGIQFLIQNTDFFNNCTITVYGVKT